ncbi:MAG: hypothetical protein NW218_02630 [Saprospiraceae bacterium]|nr:hypothetical protein [Saprospiraceae bacterium]
MAKTTLFEKESIRSGLVTGHDLHALDALTLDVIFVFPTLNAPPPRFGLLTKRIQRATIIKS